MKTILIFAAGLMAALIFAGCETVPPGVEQGPHGTIAYDVLIDASAPGARIEANGEAVGNTPVHVKIFGDKDGTFHDFGSFYYLVRAFPVTTNQFAQVRAFHTGRRFTPEDQIPHSIYFDMNQNTPAYLPPEPPPYYYYGPPPYYGPEFRFYVGPPPYRHWHRWR